MNINLKHGDCLERLKDIPDNSLEAIISDPPYELGFMGKGWDATGIAYNPELWKHIYRILKPGGIVKTFGGTRTFHRVAAAMEKAGFSDITFESWLFGSGFPKSLNISKAIDKMEGAKRESHNSPPITENAKKWDGWGTALKPAHEPVVVGRKPGAPSKTAAGDVDDILDQLLAEDD